MACSEPSSNIKELQEEFARFFGPVLKQMRDDKSKRRRPLSEIMSDMERDGNAGLGCYSVYREPAKRVRYISDVGFVTACLVHQHFLKYLNKNDDLIRIIKTNSSIRICCLAGGSAVEAVGICKAISDFFKANYNSSCEKAASGFPVSQVSIHVTIVDVMSDWENDTLAILTAADASSIIDSELVAIHPKFIRANLFERYENDLEEEIKKADIVTMVSLGSVLEKKQGMISLLCQNLPRILNLLKIDSCFFIKEITGFSFPHLKNAVCRATLTNVESQQDVEYFVEGTSIDILDNLATPDLNYEKHPGGVLKTSSLIYIRTESLRKEEIATKTSEKIV